MNTEDLQQALTQHFNERDAARRRLVEEDTIRITRLQETRRKFVAYLEKDVRPALQAAHQVLRGQGLSAQLTEATDLTTDTTPLSIRLQFGAQAGAVDNAREVANFSIEAKLVEGGVVRITYTQREGNIHPVRSTDFRLLEAPSGNALRDIILDCVKSCLPIPSR